ncbi:MAG: BlaI/MecI/CopY family transcriptional regulator [Candidatus Acidiferrales bacterium]|jgi:BlaI family transcriptional regulator, penicillinase repressor
MTTPLKPTASELDILHVLWDRGPSTVRDVHAALSEKRDLGYTTVLKLMQIMTVKGLVRRNEEQRAHVYEACLPAEKTKRQLAADTLERVFEGSASQLMLHALAGHRSSKHEIAELRRLLDDYERKLR